LSSTTSTTTWHFSHYKIQQMIMIGIN
jgi:hypothetical protein